jgi:hypothetical protein
MTGGDGWYNSLQLKFERRYKNGFQMLVSYTNSKTMEAVGLLNNSDAKPAPVLTSWDVPQRLMITAIYELPFGRRQRWLSALPGWADRVAGGWQLQVVYIGQSGSPMGFGNVIFMGNLHDLVLPVSQRTPERWFNIDAGFKRSSTKQLASNYQTFPVRLTGLRTDGLNDWNMSVIKRIPLKERVTFEVRAEAKNALNHAMFGGPNTSVTSTLFGQITGSQGARQITMMGKLSW